MKLTRIVMISLISVASNSLFAQTNQVSNYPVAEALVKALSKVSDGGDASYMKSTCAGLDVRKFDNCLGTFTYPNGNIYSGEFKNGRRDGVGVLRVLAKGIPDKGNIRSNIPSTFVGEFHNDKINGVGTWFTDNGDSYLGVYVDNMIMKNLSK